MAQLLQVFWATMERAVPRVATALIIVLFARFTNPSTVGVYAWVALTYTLYQAIAENALRTQAVLSLRNAAAEAYVRRGTRVAAVLGSAMMMATLSVLALVYHGEHMNTIVGLTPFLVVPFVTTSHVIPSAYMQFGQQWSQLARYQLVASMCGLCVSLTIVMTLHSSLAMSAHVLLAEGTFWALTRRAKARIMIVRDQPSRDERRETAEMVVLSALGWGQNQLERVFIGIFASVATLGLYSTASAMGRSPGEALSTAISNYVRSRIAVIDEGAEQARVLRNIGLVGVFSGAVSAGLLVVFVDLVLRPFLGVTWNETLKAVPFFAVATIPYTVSLTLQLISISNRRGRASVTAALVGLSCSLPIGLLSAMSFQLAALMVIVKECLVLLTTQLLGRERGSWLPWAAAYVCTGIMATMFLFMRS